MYIRNFARIQLLLIVLILIYFLCIHKPKNNLERLEKKNIEHAYKEFVKHLPGEYRNKLSNVSIELTDTSVGFCKNKKVIGVYRSKGHKHKISQKEVILHECAHVVNDSLEHDESFWKHYETLQGYGKDYFNISY